MDIWSTEYFTQLADMILFEKQFTAQTFFVAHPAIFGESLA